jgi:hypothetical protein
MTLSIVWQRVNKCLRHLCLLACLAISGLAVASEHHGQVTFGGLPVSGATVTATQGNRKFVAISDGQGNYSFPDLPDGPWKIDVEMSGFAALQQDVTIASGMPGIKWELKMLPLDQIIAQTKIVKAAPEPAPTPEVAAAPGKSQTPKPADTAEMPKPPENSGQQPSDGLVVNGSVNNAATSQFSLAQAFGNTRKGTRSLYTGGLSLILDNSALDARPYSLSGLETPKPSYNTITAGVALGGPLNIPHLMPRGPNFFIGYQWKRSQTSAIYPGLVPTQEQRESVDPIDAQAQALLTFYPLPNVANNPIYNYQVQELNNTHQDSLQTRLDKSIGHRDQVYGNFAYQSTRADSSNLFGFVDTTDTLGIHANINWNHRFNHGLFLNTGFEFSRLRTQVTPFFAGRTNVSGDAGITGNDSTPSNWGPPTLVFASGIASLTDGTSLFNRNRTDEISPSLSYYRGRHNYTFGGDFRRQEFNYLQQANPRGEFDFLNTSTDFADFTDFLQGVPDISRISFGNADKYLRQSVYDLYATDDWRIRPDLTLNIGARWEYGAPITELQDRLVNLDVAPGFSAISQVLASDPVGTLTGQRYPHSLLRPDRNGIEPRVALSWRPIPGSSVVVRAGYGIYQDTSVYQATALQLADQAPFAKALNLVNSASCPLTLANGFTPSAQCSSASVPDTFAVDPNFRVGYAQTWQLSVQRDLPFALQMTATYLGIKGTRGVQEFIPNTYPDGATNPCPQCPTNFVYRTSNGNSTREAASFQLRRRLRSGFTATLLYTYSKSIDDDSTLGGQGPVPVGGASPTVATVAVAQNWLDLKAERGPSTFDQRNLLNVNLQYTTGMGIGGGTLMSGWRGRVIKEWTAVAQIVAGSGLPETPTYLAAVAGTGITGPIRASLTGAPVYAAPPGLFLNPAAYQAPLAGQWGNAGRDSIVGPGEFTFNASLARTFRLTKQYNLDVRVDSTNLLNHVVFNSWNTTINSAQFGVPVSANAMRSLQTTARLRF